MREYRSTTAYQLARALVASVCGATGAERERPAPISSLRRAAIAAAANLVEGSARTRDEEYLRCLDASRAAMAEMPVHINLCQLRGHLPVAAARSLLAEQADACAALDRLIAEARHLARQIDATNHLAAP